jgi:hypothetical protein
MKRAGMQALQEPLGDKLGAQIQPLDLVDDFGFQVLFNGHGLYRSRLALARLTATQRPARKSRQ